MFHQDLSGRLTARLCCPQGGRGVRQLQLLTAEPARADHARFERHARCACGLHGPVHAQHTGGAGGEDSKHAAVPGACRGGRAACVHGWVLGGWLGGCIRLGGDSLPLPVDVWLRPDLLRLDPCLRLLPPGNNNNNWTFPLPSSACLLSAHLQLCKYRCVWRWKTQTRWTM